jgi:hypothetical protein
MALHGQIPGDGFECHHIAPQRPDDIGKRRAHAGRVFRDVLEPRAQRRTCGRLLRRQIGEQADAAELRAHLVVQIHRDPRALPLECHHVRDAGAVRNRRQAERGERRERQEPAPPIHRREHLKRDRCDLRRRLVASFERANLQSVTTRDSPASTIERFDDTGDHGSWSVRRYWNRSRLVCAARQRDEVDPRLR